MNIEKIKLMKQLIDLYQVGETPMSDDVAAIFVEYVLRLENELIELLKNNGL